MQKKNINLAFQKKPTFFCTHLPLQFDVLKQDGKPSIAGSLTFSRSAPSDICLQHGP